MSKKPPGSAKDRSPQGQRIFRLRKDVLNLDQEGFAQRLDVKQATVSRWESGEITPSRAVYRELARLAPPNSDIQRDLLIDGGFSHVTRRMRELNESELPDTKNTTVLRWDRELMVFVIAAVNKELRKRGRELSDEKYATLVALFYELCYQTGQRDSDIVEQLLKIA